MDRQGVSVRELARRITAENPTLAFEDARRSVARWLTSGEGAVEPSQASRESVAKALGVAVEALGGERDEEEPDVPTLMRRAIRELRAAERAIRGAA